MPRFTAASLLLHALFLVLLGISLPTMHVPVLAEPLYEVALVPSQTPNYVPPRPATPPEAPPEKKTVTPPPEKPKPESVPVDPAPAVKKPEKKEPEKPIETRKPPQKRPETTKPEETPQAAPAPPTPAPAGEVSLGRVDQQSPLDQSYRNIICQRVAENWDHQGLRPGLNKTTVRFIIHKDGTIDDDITTFVKSGSTLYDRAALSAIYALQRQGGIGLPLPASYGEETLTVYMDFLITGEGER